MFIGDWMDRGERYFPDATAIVDVASGLRLSYREMNLRANRLAASLRSHGVQRGERVAFLAQNGVECLDFFFACAKLGAVFIPLNWRLHAEEQAELLNDTGPVALAYSDDFRAIAEHARHRCPHLKRFIHFDGPGLPGSLPFVDLIASGEERVSNEAIDGEDIACLLFTGGTTGRSKGAKISYRMIAWNTLNTLIHELARGDITITHTPMFHTGGLFVYTMPLLTLGGTVIITRKWDPELILSLIEREKVSVFFGTPTHFQQLLQAPSFATRDLRSLRFLTSGGAPLPVPLIHEFQAIHKVPFKQGFGMTEFGPGIFSMPPEFATTKAGSIGRPNYFIEAQLFNDENRPVAVGEVGEIVLKGPSCFSGYFSLQGQSGVSTDEHGWFHTGDLAKRDEDGFFFIVDRKKDMFISGGENVFPAEVEKALYEHPAVFQCAVIGVPDEKWGEVGRAFVVLRPGHSVSEPDLIEFTRGRLARYKVPKSVVFLDALPTSPAGKILRRALS